MERQHCMLCGSSVIADVQSPNCRSSKAPAAIKTNSLLAFMYLDSRAIRLTSQRLQYASSASYEERTAQKTTHVGESSTRQNQLFFGG